MAEPEVHGPIDFVLIEFPGDGISGPTADAIRDLVDNGTIRLYDILVIEKGEDGSFAGIDLAEASADKTGGFSAFAGARSGLLQDDDVREAADAMDAGTTAVLIVYENSWAIPFVAAALDAGGEMIASMRIPAQDVIDALDSIDSAS